MSGSHDPGRPRLGKRIPSGPRPPSSSNRGSTLSSASLPSIAAVSQDGLSLSEEIEQILEGGHVISASPENSPPESRGSASPITAKSNGGSIIVSAASNGRKVTFPAVLETAKLITAEPESGSLRPTTPPPQGTQAKSKPKVLRLNTANLLASPTKPVGKAISPSLKHWQQVRSHVLATPAEEREREQSKEKTNQHGKLGKGLVSKAVARFGFRNAAENVIGYQDRRRSMAVLINGLGDLTPEEREEIARERRRFARDIKACLDACSLEESRRRLARAGSKARRDSKDTKALLSTTNNGNPVFGYSFNPDFSAFAPLLTELHKYLPAARARKAWSRTCPHHAAILAELATAFLPDSYSTDGERQQALEVFGVIVRSWASDNAEEELTRWIWLCNALSRGDRQLRNRGLPLLSSFLHNDPALPTAAERPYSALAFQSLAIALLELVHAVSESQYDAGDHISSARVLLTDLANGEVIDVDEKTLVAVLGMNVQGKVGGVEKDLLWSAIATVMGSSSMADWLLLSKNQSVLQYVPPPILHATPPVILHLRARSTLLFFASLSTVITALPNSLLQRVWEFATESLLSDIDHLPDDEHGLPRRMASFLWKLLLHTEYIHSGHGTGYQAEVIQAIVRLLDGAEERGTEERIRDIQQALQQVIIASTDVQQVTELLQVILAEKSLQKVQNPAVSCLFEKCVAEPTDATGFGPFLVNLAKTYPQLFFKPLFSLSACTSINNLKLHLQTVRMLSSSVGARSFWLEADPQMITIVLMGGTTPRASKGKGKEGEEAIASIKVGRYAVMVEILISLDSLKRAETADKKVQTMLHAVESRIGTLLEAEEAQARLPDPYRALLCLLCFRIRKILQSTQKSPWQRLVMKWFLGSQAASRNSLATEPLHALREVHRSMLLPPVTMHKADRKPSRSHTGVSDNTALTATLPVIDKASPLHRLLHPDLLASCAELMVLLQSCWTLDDWSEILPRSWRLYSQSANSLSTGPIAFLLMKCGETVPAQMTALVAYDLQHVSPVIRCQAVRNIASLYAYRRQILSQTTLNDRRGPLFQFSHKTLDFVLTEIGSSHWSPPVEMQDEILQKFGRVLPLDVKQRLLQLGWSDDPSIATKDDHSKIPISALPTGFTSEQDKDKVAPGGKQLTRQLSSGSGSGAGIKTRRAIFPPALWQVVANHAVSGPTVRVDAGADTLARDLVRLFQRDEASLFIRPFAEDFSNNFAAVITRLNAAGSKPTPAFAYAAFNAVVGYLKHALRHDPAFPHHTRALSTIVHLVPFVSEISLREIRKNKAEHVLLPASIHEDEGGFKVHAAWRDSDREVQATQLHVVNEILKASPREVHLVKRMLSNLQVQDSLLDLGVARAWLLLALNLLGKLNRNSNEKAELRHILSTTASVLRQHAEDLLVVAHCMRIFMLCAARFRRLFATMGFQTIMQSVFDTYASGNSATRDCIEYAMRSFYRIHQDAFAYQSCLTVSENNCDPAAAYELLCSLAIGNDAHSGIASGIRGLNDREELDALIQMLSGPEIALHEIGKDKAERQASKLAEATFEKRLFPKENIIRLLVTVIATNPPSSQAVRMLNLFGLIVPSIKDVSSAGLLRDGVDALGNIISRQRVDVATGPALFHQDPAQSDWTSAKIGYVRLVEAFAKSGGQLIPPTAKIVLDLVLDLLNKGHEVVYPAASSILRELSKTNLSARRPVTFLKSISGIYHSCLGNVDVSGVLDSVIGYIRMNEYELDEDTSQAIIDRYLEPSIAFMVRSTEDGIPVEAQFRTSVVDLSVAMLSARADVVSLLADEVLHPSYLAYLVYPLVTTLRLPPGVDSRPMWIRILRLLIKPYSGDSNSPITARAAAANLVLSLQAVKVILVRAPDAISGVKGLWIYIATYLTELLGGLDAHFARYDAGSLPPKWIDWMAWSLYELLSLHRSPILLHLRFAIQSALISLQNAADDHSRPSSPGHSPSPRRSPSPDRASPNIDESRMRILSLRRPSGIHGIRQSISQAAFDPTQSPTSRMNNRLSPSPTPEGRDSPRVPSPLGTPHSETSAYSHPRNLSVSGRGNRPSFADLSHRRASTAVFNVPPPAGMQSNGMRNRFASSAPIRSVFAEKQGTGLKVGGPAGGAIIHLLGAPNQVLAAASGVATNPMGRRGSVANEAIAELRLSDSGLIKATKRAVRVCQMVFGYKVELDEDEEPVQIWSASEALHAISEQTRLFVERECRDLLDTANAGAEVRLDEKSGYHADALRTFDEKTLDDKDSLEDQMDERDGDDVPLVSVSFS